MDRQGFVAARLTWMSYDDGYCLHVSFNLLCEFVCTHVWQQSGVFTYYNIYNIDNEKLTYNGDD